MARKLGLQMFLFSCLSNAVKYVVGIISIYFSLDITEIFRPHNNFTPTVNTNNTVLVRNKNIQSLHKATNIICLINH